VLEKPRSVSFCCFADVNYSDRGQDKNRRRLVHPVRD
jgi:hypothetical protein